MSFIKLKLVLTLCVYLISAYEIRPDHKYRRQNLTNGIEITARSIEQPLDHFDKKENRTWYMLYLERLDLWKAGGPIYVFVGGESEAEFAFLLNGLMYELANETNGALFGSEHRYYGESQPFPKINTEHLAYLSSRQALADLAKLLKFLKSSPQYNSSKVVVVGGSYAGNLAAWMRLLYPDLVDAAIASSAPVLAKKDFYEYLEVVGGDFKQFGTPDCYNKIEKRFNRYEQLLQNSTGIKQLKKEENICEETDMLKQENQAFFFELKSTPFKYIAQYGRPGIIKRLCKKLNINNTKSLRLPGTSLRKRFALLDFDVWKGEPGCFDYDFEVAIKRAALNPWLYQMCTEFGFFQIGSSDKQPFTKKVNLDFLYKICTKMFGPKFNEERVDRGVKNTNDMYGGLKPNVSKVVFVNGDIDPWHKLGVVENLSEDAPARLLHGTSHCADLNSNRSDDPEELKEVRKYVKSLIKKWIGVH